MTTEINTNQKLSYPGIEAVVADFEEAQTEVRSRLRYHDHQPWDEFDQRSPANCLGFTALTSEILEERSIRHKVGFVNGHAMIYALIDDGEKHEQWMFDSLAPRLNQRVDNAFVPISHEEDDRDFAFVFPASIKTDHLSSGVPLGQKYPWLSLAGESAHHKLERRNPLNHRLLATLYAPATGRAVLASYQEYSSGIENEQNNRAAQAVIAMSGVFPDIDIRSYHPSTVLRLVKDLSHEDQIEPAEQVVDAFFDSFEVSRDTRVDEYRADCFRAISKITGQGHFATKAIKLYEDIMRRPKAHKSSVAGKLEASRTLA